MNELIKQLRAQGIEVTTDGDHKTSEISFEVDGRTIIIKGDAPLKRAPGFYLGILWGCTEPSISDRFDTAEERDAELKRMLNPSHEDSIDEEDAIFTVYIDEDGNCDLGPFSNDEVDEMRESVEAGED